jgi:hypothetical protein
MTGNVHSITRKPRKRLHRRIDLDALSVEANSNFLVSLPLDPRFAPPSFSDPVWPCENDAFSINNHVIQTKVSMAKGGVRS